MAFAKIKMTNGFEVKQVPLGFSWTTFFFGPWPAILRQDWIPGIIILVACLFTWGLAGIVAAFIYNKYYAKSLFAKGYHVNHMPDGMTNESLADYLGYVKLPNTVE